MNYVCVGQCKDGLLMMQLEVSCSEGGDQMKRVG